VLDKLGSIYVTQNLSKSKLWQKITFSTILERGPAWSLHVLAAGHCNPDFGFGPQFTGCNATVSGHDAILSFDIMKESK